MNGLSKPPDERLDLLEHLLEMVAISHEWLLKSTEGIEQSMESDELKHARLTQELIDELKPKECKG